MTALIHLRDTTGEAGQPSEMLQKLSEAAQYLREVPPLLQSKLLIELARAYGWNGKSQEALHSIGEARATLPEENTFVPIFLSGDSDLFHLILLEGQTHLGMGDHLASSNHYEQAGKLFAQIETLPSTVVIPERIRIEIINQQALGSEQNLALRSACKRVIGYVHQHELIACDTSRKHPHHHSG